jgi:SAP domain-containing new25
MPKRPQLSKSMTERQFDNGYWYAVEIKAFANEIGIPLASKLRKDELEKLIKHFFANRCSRESDQEKSLKIRSQRY